MARRAYVDPSVLESALSGQPLVLDKDATHHFLKVLRLSSGASIELFDGTGRVARGELEVADRAFLKNPIVEIREIKGPIIVVAQALSKMEKLEEVVQRSTELGAQKIIFFKAERSVVHWGDKIEQKMTRLVRIAQEAARQSERIDVPTLIGSISFAELLDTCAQFQGVKVMGDPYGESRLSDLLELESQKIQKGILLVVGPEGGLSSSEMSNLGSHAVLSVKWGPHVLRTETAALAALSVIQVMLENA